MARSKTKERSCNIGNRFKEGNGKKPGVECTKGEAFYMNDTGSAEEQVPVHRRTHRVEPARRICSFMGVEWTTSSRAHPQLARDLSDLGCQYDGG